MNSISLERAVRTRDFKSSAARPRFPSGITKRAWHIYLLSTFLAMLIYASIGCSDAGTRSAEPQFASVPRPLVRVLLGEQKTSIVLAALQPPSIRTVDAPAPRRLDIPASPPSTISLTPGGWRIANIIFGRGELTIDPASDGSARIDGLAYHGRFRLVPRGPHTFDVVNDVDIEAYLKGVLPRELLKTWNDETYKAQAVVARTYAIYELKAANANSHYDLFSDQRSQVYGGISAESSKANEAVDQTKGTVVVAGAPGQERIFKAYFSSCCGGIGQSAADAFGDSPSLALTEQAVGNLCRESPRFNWGPVVISKTALTARFQKFGLLRNRVEKNMSRVDRIEIAAYNKLGRPVKFAVTDVRGLKYYWSGEEIRWAVNTDATETTKLFSSLFQIDNNAGAIRFINGHGLGHGTGMCQWCAQSRAERGMKYDQIVMSAFLSSKLLQAY